ncbi:hypothetical protein A0H81_04228 [Grifola frondosa]|uniref:Uncharacterized protein n=1 Tax=Grifola frondosa TaxID=5627 RepID=A0A1C7ME12_GRIFR|nr:hypothetical protein A0H81_04228 [Grifola frondosa]
MCGCLLAASWNISHCAGDAPISFPPKCLLEAHKVLHSFPAVPVVHVDTLLRPSAAFDINHFAILRLSKFPSSEPGGELALSLRNGF